MGVEICSPVAWVPSWPDLFRPSTSLADARVRRSRRLSAIASREGGSERRRKIQEKKFTQRSAAPVLSRRSKLIIYAAANDVAVISHRCRRRPGFSRAAGTDATATVADCEPRS